MPDFYVQNQANHGRIPLIFRKRMRPFWLLPLVFLGGFSGVFAQKGSPVEYEPCAQEQTKSALSKFEDAFEAYQDGKFGKSVGLLRELISEEPDFASPVFLLGIVGVATENTSMIEKYFPQVLGICPEFHHPLLFYYLGIIEYSEERFAAALPHFERFLSLSMAENSYENLQKEAINYLNWCRFLHETTGRKFPFLPQKIANISSERDEVSPCITQDESRIFFFRELSIRQNSDESFYQKTEFITKNLLHVAEKDPETGEYDLGFPLEETHDLNASFGRISVTADERWLFFAKNTSTFGQNSMDIYLCEAKNGQFSEAKPLGSAVNSPESNEIHPSISPDGNTIFFASDRKNGYGGYDIYVSFREKDGTWSEPDNLGRRVNSAGDDTNPFIHGDNHSLYFASNGWKTIGKSDLFYIDLEEIKMKTPRNLGANINTSEDETELYLLKNGEVAYASVFDSVEKNFDICLFSLPKEVHAEGIRHVKGSVFADGNEDKSAKISVHSIHKHTNVTYESEPENGGFALSLPQKEDCFIKAIKEGYAYNSQILKANDTLSTLNLRLLPLENGENYPLNHVFSDEKGQLSKETLFVLDDFIAWLKERERLRIELFSPDNLAEKVAFYLIKSGIREDRIAVSPTPQPQIGFRLQ